MQRLVVFYHKASISYSKVIHRKKEIRLAFLFFYKTAKKKGKMLILLFFIFVELEINMWITKGRCRVVADN
jgi:hypothetical protein